jgi:alanyl-tRNA synthetase
MEYEKKDGKIIGKLKQKNVDTGAGLERVTTVVQKKSSIYDTDCFENILKQAKLIASNEKSARIVADHLRTATFLIGDGVLPSNTDRGYILRRILRRAIFHTDKKSLQPGEISDFVNVVSTKYGRVYPELTDKIATIKEVIQIEAEKFSRTVNQGIKELNKVENLTGEKAFDIYQSYGLPLEMAEEIKPVENREDFFKLMKKHQELSRTGSEKKFKGGLGDTSNKSVQYHTATHLLNAALRQVLGEHVMQKGSNITPERLRFDFSHGEKMTDDQKAKVENLVNTWIEAKLPVNLKEMPINEAKKVALHSFNEKYGNTVKVYSIGTENNYVSREFCGGPHVNNTSELPRFKIIKEEAVSAGVRRIKAILN